MATGPITGSARLLASAMLAASAMRYSQLRVADPGGLDNYPICVCMCMHEP
jgi:hypothetical protein